MSFCLAAGSVILQLATAEFTLSWTHSVEKTGWRETWHVEADKRLKLIEAAVRGSGAGMEPGDGAKLKEGWWVWTPKAASVPSLLLAASGATGAGWTLCDQARCQLIGANAGEPVLLKACSQ